MFVRNLNEAEPFRTKDGSVVRSILDKATAPVANQSLAEARLEPGLSTTPHLHPRSEEFYLITRGRGDMEVGGERRPVKEGDAVLIPPGTPHRITNTGEVALTILCCCAPAYDHGDTVLLERVPVPES